MLALKFAGGPRRSRRPCTSSWPARGVAKANVSFPVVRRDGRVEAPYRSTAPLPAATCLTVTAPYGSATSAADDCLCGRRRLWSPTTVVTDLLRLARPPLEVSAHLEPCGHLPHGASPCKPLRCTKPLQSTSMNQGRYHPACAAAHRASRPTGTGAQHEEERWRRAKLSKPRCSLLCPRPPHTPSAPSGTPRPRPPPTVRASSTSPPFADHRALRALPERVLCVPSVNDSASELPQRHQHLPSHSHAALSAQAAPAGGTFLAWADTGWLGLPSAGGARGRSPQRAERAL